MGELRTLYGVFVKFAAMNYGSGAILKVVARKQRVRRVSLEGWESRSWKYVSVSFSSGGNETKKKPRQLNSGMFLGSVIVRVVWVSACVHEALAQQMIASKMERGRVE